MVEMPGVGHMPHEEAPEAFLDAVTAFVDER
jgi:pimeloyl-ACP methyl ester carboxylesterase